MRTTSDRSHLKALPPRSVAPLRAAYEAFLLALRAAGRRPRTIEFYREKLGPFVVWLESQRVTRPEAITATHIRAYLLDREEAGRAARSVHHHASTIRAFCNWLVDEELLSASPMRKVKMPKVDDPLLPAFDEAEVAALLKAAPDPRDHAILLFLLDTGARASEFCALNFSDLDLETGTVHIRTGKNRKGRIVYLGSKARLALMKYLRLRGDVSAEAPLWVRKTPSHELDTARMVRENLHETLRRIGERAGVHCHPHKFRRSFALWSLRSGMSIYALRQLMGHGDLQILQRYLALVQEDLADAHREHGPVDGLLAKKGKGR